MGVDEDGALLPSRRGQAVKMKTSSHNYLRKLVLKDVPFYCTLPPRVISLA